MKTKTQSSLDKKVRLGNTWNNWIIYRFVIATTHVCKLLLQRISSQKDALNKSHGIEASYITVHVHLYDILVINTLLCFAWLM